VARQCTLQGMKKHQRPVTGRTIQLKVMLTSSERDLLNKVAKLKGLTASDVVRQWIRATTGNT
jgi:hypothetical protein